MIISYKSGYWYSGIIDGQLLTFQFLDEGDRIIAGTIRVQLCSGDVKQISLPDPTTVKEIGGESPCSNNSKK